jgi:AraC-like DNA-binding protein
MIRKARAVWCGSGRAGRGDLLSDSGVLANTPCSFRIRFENEKGTHPEELIVTIEQDKEGYLVRYLVVDLRTSQSIHSLPGHPAHTDPLIQRFERWARGLLAEGFSLEQAAHALATSKRTLARRMQSVLGKSPLAFFQDLRVERAVHLLRTSHASVDQIAAEVGYAEGSTLRALLRRRVGRGVREIRRGL